MAAIYRALIADEERLDQIVWDVLTAADDGANLLVLASAGSITATPLRSACALRAKRSSRRAAK